MGERVYKRCLNNVDELKQRLIDVRRGLQQTVIDLAVNEWRMEEKHVATCLYIWRHYEHSLLFDAIANLDRKNLRIVSNFDCSQNKILLQLNSRIFSFCDFQGRLVHRC